MRKTLRNKEAVQTQANKCILAATSKLEDAKLDAFKIETGTSSGTQIVEANRSKETMQSSVPRNRKTERSQQSATPRMVIPLCFVGLPEDRPHLFKGIIDKLCCWLR